MDPEFNKPIKHKKREVGTFLCREMLFDYLDKKLDPERSAAVEVTVKRVESLQEDLEAISFAMEYTNQLSQLKVSEDLVYELLNQESWKDRWLKRARWSNWPDMLKWVSEATTVAILVSALAIFVPWEQVVTWFQKETSTIAIVEKPDPNLPAPVKSEEAESSGEATVVVAEKNEDGQQAVGAPDLDEDDPMPSETPTAGEKAGVATNVTETRLIDRQRIQNPKPVVQSEGLQPKGSVFRIEMELADLASVTPQVVARIEALGGTRAGKVRLGWQKKDDSSYYHFALPAKNEQAMMNYLKSLGKFKLSQDPHWRVMPEGEIRVILEMFKSPSGKSGSQRPVEGPKIDSKTVNPPSHSQELAPTPVESEPESAPANSEKNEGARPSDSTPESAPTEETDSIDVPADGE